MSKILELRDAVVSTMQGLTDEGERFYGINISSHGGDFDTEEELKRYAVKTPHIVVSVLRTDMGAEGGLPVANVVLGAFVVTMDKPTLPRADAALAISDNVLDYITRFPTKPFGVEAGRPKNVLARNLYSATFDKKNVAVWGVFWHQAVTLVPPVAPQEPDLHVIHVDWDISPRDHAVELGAVPDAEDFIDLDILQD